MAIFSFGEYKDNSEFKVLDERRVRASSGFMFLIGGIASINGFILQQYEIIPWMIGFLVLNFMIAIFINPKFAPTMFLGYLFTYRQSRMPIGAVQKKFAWSLGLGLSIAIFVLSLFLLEDASYFDAVCGLCLICLLLLYLETAFAICVGCKLYHWSVRIGLLRKPKVNPNCMGDVCKTDG